MSFLNSIESMIGGSDLQRLAGGNGNFDNGDSDDAQHVQNMVSQANSSMLSNIFGQAAGNMNSQNYANHLSGGGSGNPLSALGSGGLSTIASMLMGHLMNSGGYSSNSLLSKIPGLQTTNPQQMDANQVAAVANYTQQNHPDIFGRVAAMLGKQQPSLLHSFLGSGGMAAAAQALASHFLNRA